MSHDPGRFQSLSNIYGIYSTPSGRWLSRCVCPWVLWTGSCQVGAMVRGRRVGPGALSACVGAAQARLGGTQ